MKSRKMTGIGWFIILIFLLVPTQIHAGWEIGGNVGYDSNVNRAIEDRKSDTYLSGHLSFLKEASGESRIDWTFLAFAEGAAYAKNNDLSYAALSVAPGLTFFPYLTWTINVSPFIQGKAVIDSDQSAVAFGAKVSLKQLIGKHVYTGQYYVYTDSRANEDVYSYTENAVGIFLGVNWTSAFFSEIGYEYSHGDSFQSIPTTSTTVTESPGMGRGQHRRYSSTFGTDLIREKVDRHSVGITVGIDFTKSVFSHISYTYTAVDGELGSYPINAGYIGIGYRF